MLHVLVVDGHPDWQEIIRNALERLSETSFVWTVSTTRAAVEYLSEHQSVNLVIVSVEQDNTGHFFVLRKMASDKRIAFMDMLPKPFELWQFGDKVADVLKTHKGTPTIQ